MAVVDHREMVPPLYQPLLTPVYWIRPIYTELLHAASRIKKDTRTEVARPSNGLVKIICSGKALGMEPVNATADNKGMKKKKKIILLPEGILIQPNNTYIPKLISLLKVSGRRGTGLPYHSTLKPTMQSWKVTLNVLKENKQLLADQLLV